MNNPLKYPFSKKARQVSQEYSRDLGALTKLLEEPESLFIIKAAEQRILSSLNAEMLELPSFRNKKDVLIYPTARIMVEEIANPQLQAKQAEAESKAINKVLSKEKDNFIINLCKESFNWDIISTGTLHDRMILPPEINKYELKIKFTDFLEVSPIFHAVQWKLINRFISKGWILIYRNEIDRLISGRFNKIILSTRLNIPKLPEEVNNSISRIRKELKSQIPERKPFEIEGQVNTAYPPCIQKMYDDSVRGHVNLSHVARFALAAFLLKIGMEESEVDKIFDQSPDKNLNLASYQVRHIARKKSITSETKGYMPTGCRKLQLNNLCPSKDQRQFDPLCEYILNPLSFYNTRAWEITNKVMSRKWYAEKKDKRQFL